MSPPWSKPLEIDRLADSQADLDFAVPLAELTRLRSQHSSIAGTVQGHAHFAREAGFPVVELHMSGTAHLTCQRCLQEMLEPVTSAARIALIGTEADAARVPEHLEPMLAAGGQISIGELVEEEMLLSLPIVPLHAAASECQVGSGSHSAADPEPQHTTQRPFEQLRDLLKRS